MSLYRIQLLQFQISSIACHGNSSRNSHGTAGSGCESFFTTAMSNPSDAFHNLHQSDTARRTRSRAPRGKSTPRMLGRKMRLRFINFGPAFRAVDGRCLRLPPELQAQGTDFGLGRFGTNGYLIHHKDFDNSTMFIYDGDESDGR